MITSDYQWPDHFQIVDWAYTESNESLTFNQYEDWLNKGLNGPLNYLKDHRKDLRRNLTEFYPDFQSAFVFLFSYAQEKKRLVENNNQYEIASYVSGFEDIDYHYWIREKLQFIANDFKKNDPTIDFVFSIDAQPVLERDLAYRAGLGWFGKNSMLINKDHGSYFIIASILVNKKFSIETKKLDIDHCGNCTACIDACPTDAIIEGRAVDSSKCISTFTIELFKEADPPKGYTNQKRVYGCDICQEVCPWNRKPLKKVMTKNESSKIENFFKRDIQLIINDLNEMSNREFRRKFKGTPLERTGRIGVLKNLKPFKD